MGRLRLIPVEPRGLPSGEDGLRQEWSRCSMRTCRDAWGNLGTWEGVAVGLGGSRREALREGSDAGGLGPSFRPRSLQSSSYQEARVAAGRGVVLAPT